MDCDADDDDDDNYNDNLVSDRLESAAGVISVLCCGLFRTEVVG